MLWPACGRGATTARGTADRCRIRSTRSSSSTPVAGSRPDRPDRPDDHLRRAVQEHCGRGSRPRTRRGGRAQVNRRARRLWTTSPPSPRGMRAGAGDQLWPGRVVLALPAAGMFVSALDSSPRPHHAPKHLPGPQLPRNRLVPAIARDDALGRVDAEILVLTPARHHTSAPRRTDPDDRGSASCTYDATTFHQQ